MQLSAKGAANGIDAVSGSVDGLAFPPVRRVTCQNLTTAQTVKFSTVQDSWNCEAAGLMVVPGNRVQQSVQGEV